MESIMATLSTDGTCGIIRRLVVHQLIDPVSSSESRESSCTVLPHSAQQIGGDADIQDAALTGQDIDEH
jgi:hypothetical protein